MHSLFPHYILMCPAFTSKLNIIKPIFGGILLFKFYFPLKIVSDSSYEKGQSGSRLCKNGSTDKNSPASHV